MLQMFAPHALKASQLTVGVTHDRKLVQSLVRQWHSVLGQPQGYRVAFLLTDQNTIVGVATWGRPVARLEDQEHTLELTRMALGPNHPYNSATFFSGKMRRWIRENMPSVERLISYQDLDAHLGTFYKADNWMLVFEQENGSKSWTNRLGRKSSERRRKAKWWRRP